MTGTIELGIYEKALAWRGGFPDLFAQAVEAGFKFIDLSVDESADRIARLDWDAEQRRAVREAAADAGIRLGGLCLSAHRKIAPGSADPAIREQARQVLFKGIDLCVDLHIPVLQLAGYYAYYEGNTDASRGYYIACLRDGAQYAALRGVQLGIENVDGTDITSITEAMTVVKEIDSPWLQLYPDIGNIAEQGLDQATELATGRGHMLALHVKDVRRGEPRRVPMGEGIVAWDDAFAELAKQQWSGRIMIEMWNDDSPESATLSAAARQFITERLKAADFVVTEPLPVPELPISLVRLREAVCEGNLALPRNGLVAWTGGNLSARDPETGLIVIKPSGVLYDEMTPQDMVIVDLDGRVVYGDRGPSSDTASHLGVYRARSDVMAIIHTHSRYATAFAAAGRPIPPVLTAIADEFGGPVPLGGYASIGGNAIGEEIIASIGDSPAILMKQHGVFTIGPSIKKALQAAVMVEDIAHTVAVAESLGTTEELPPEEIAANYDRYQNRYGTKNASKGLIQ